MGLYHGSKGSFSRRFSLSNSDETNSSEPVMILKEESLSTTIAEKDDASEVIIDPPAETMSEDVIIDPPAETMSEEVLEQIPVQKPEQINLVTAYSDCSGSGEEKIKTEGKKDQPTKNEPVMQKNVSVNYSAAKPKTSAQNSSENQKNKQSQNQIQDSTTPKTTSSAKKTSRKSNHQQDKNINSNAKTPNSIEKVAKAKEKALKRVQKKLALINSKVPKK